MAAVEPVPAVPVSGGVATVTTVQKTQTVLSKISLDKVRAQEPCHPWFGIFFHV